MSFEKFNDLNVEQRCDAIWEWGFFVGKFTGTELNKVLYALNGYFAEMHIRISDGQITDVVPVKVLTSEHRQFYLINNDNPFIRSESFAG